jgi:hypothetical protein
MIKNFLMLLVLCCFSVFGVKYHQDSRGAEIHTPFRWVVADSTAKAALSLAAADTQKFCFQLSDTSIWCLIDNSPLRWAFISGKKADSLLIRTFQAVTAGITRMNIDTAKVRAEAIDTLTAGIIKGAKTFRDTSNFTGGAYFAGIARFAGTLYAPKVDIDSMVGDVKIGGNLSISVPANNCYYSANSQCGTIYFGSSKTGGGYFHAGVENAMKILGVGGYPLVISHSSNQPIIFGTNDIERARIHGNGNVKFAGACTTSTLNTDSITINGGSYLSAYLDTTFYDSLYDANTYITNSTARIVKIGKIVTLYQPEMIGTLSGGNVLLKGIPTNLKPSGGTYSPCVVKVGIVSYPGVLSFSSGLFYLLYDNGTAYGNPAAGSDRGLHCCTITWVIN